MEEAKEEKAEEMEGGQQDNPTFEHSEGKSIMSS